MLMMMIDLLLALDIFYLENKPHSRAYIGWLQVAEREINNRQHIYLTPI